VKLARDHGESGPRFTVSAYGFKAPPKRLADQILKQELTSMLKGKARN
jgi:myo-inositol-1-phosphate synthase